MFYNSVREGQTIIMSEAAVRPARGRIHLTSAACEGTPYAGLQPRPRLSRSRGVPIRPGLCASLLHRDTHSSIQDGSVMFRVSPRKRISFTKTLPGACSSNRIVLVTCFFSCGTHLQACLTTKMLFCRNCTWSNFSSTTTVYCPAFSVCPSGRTTSLSNLIVLVLARARL